MGRLAKFLKNPLHVNNLELPEKEKGQHLSNYYRSIIKKKASSVKDEFKAEYERITGSPTPEAELQPQQGQTSFVQPSSAHSNPFQSRQSSSPEHITDIVFDPNNPNYGHLQYSSGRISPNPRLFINLPPTQ